MLLHFFRRFVSLVGLLLLLCRILAFLEMLNILRNLVENFDYARFTVHVDFEDFQFGW